MNDVEVTPQNEGSASCAGSAPTQIKITSGTGVHRDAGISTRSLKGQSSSSTGSREGSKVNREVTVHVCPEEDRPDSSRVAEVIVGTGQIVENKVG
jgi:hypothetical protein